MTHTTSERDQFAIGFAEWLRSTSWVWIPEYKKWREVHHVNFKTTQQLLTEYINTLKDETGRKGN